jgi:hypothetical protein
MRPESENLPPRDSVRAHMICSIGPINKTQSHASSRDHKAKEQVSPSLAETIQFQTSSIHMFKHPATTQPTNFCMIQNMSILGFHIAQIILIDDDSFNLT